jgi:hypothetical protein
MAITLNVKSENEAVRVHREAVAQRVLEHFGSCLPRSRLLCFLDEDDPPSLKGERGAANRGLYGPIHDNTPMADWPEYVTSLIFVDDDVSIPFPRVIDDLVYLYGSTCANEVGLVMTLAHELQHAIQHANMRKLWAVNGLIQNLDRKIIDVLKLTWADIPTEREARIVSKRTAVHLVGVQRVEEYLDEKIAERTTEADAADWLFVRRLTPSGSVDLDAETKQLLGRLRSYRSELQEVLQEKKDAKNPDFLDIELDGYLIESGQR